MPKLRIGKWTAKEANVLRAEGLIRVNPNKPLFGSIMLIEDEISLRGGFVTKRNKTGFIVGRVDALETIIKQFNLKEGDDYCAKLGPHKIVTVEKLESETPEGRGFKAKLNPTTGEILTKDGEPIYWRRNVVPESDPATDELIDHDRTPNPRTERDAKLYEGLDDKSIQEFAGAAEHQQRGK